MSPSQLDSAKALLLSRAADIARNGSVAAFQEMVSVPRDAANNHTYGDVMEAVGKALAECETQIRALPLCEPARPASGEAVAWGAFDRVTGAFCGVARARRDHLEALLPSLKENTGADCVAGPLHRESPAPVAPPASAAPPRCDDSTFHTPAGARPKRETVRNRVSVGKWSESKTDEPAPARPDVPVGVAWKREEIKRIFMRYANVESGSEAMFRRDEEIDAALLAAVRGAS